MFIPRRHQLKKLVKKKSKGRPFGNLHMINKTLKPKQEIDDTYLKNGVSAIFMIFSGDDLVSRKYIMLSKYDF